MHWYRLENMGKFSNQSFAKKLKADLETDNDGDRSLKEIDPISATQMFGILGLHDPQCDANGDGTIKGDELKCLNYAWKAFLPGWSFIVKSNLLYHIKVATIKMGEPSQK